MVGLSCSLCAENSVTDFLSAYFPSLAPRQMVEQEFRKADIRLQGSRPWDIQVHQEDFYGRLVRDGSMGLGEAYMDGWWDCQSLDGFIYHLLRGHLDERSSWSTTELMGWLYAHLLNPQSRSASMAVIDRHYQLGDDLFQRMLDPTMAYSCGYWRQANSLQEAQAAKYDLIARKLGLKSGMRVLDIGCGWGGFAKHISHHYGVSVVGLTLSEHQAAYARNVCKGLPVEIRLQDYRDLHTEQFDRVVEIGMFEHVGPKNYRLFMEIVHNHLKPGGLFMLHTIGSNRTNTAGDPWIDRYIFPNGHLPSIAQIGKSIEGLFVMEDWHNFGVDYDKTLLAWHDRFTSTWEEIKTAYPPHFYRMWTYYLLSCAGAFRARSIQLWQVVLSKGGVEGGYLSVR